MEYLHGMLAMLLRMYITGFDIMLIMPKLLTI